MYRLYYINILLTPLYFFSLYIYSIYVLSFFFSIVSSILSCFQIGYNKMYIIDPGCSMQVEALADAYGLKVAIVYDASPDRNILMYERWQCKNDSTLTVTQFVGSEISTFGGTLFLFFRTLLSFLPFISSLSFPFPSYWVMYMRNHSFFVLNGCTVDDTKSVGKGETREKKEEEFARAIEALTYVSPVTRSNVKR